METAGRCTESVLVVGIDRRSVGVAVEFMKVRVDKSSHCRCRRIDEMYSQKLGVSRSGETVEITDAAPDRGIPRIVNF